jgi:hypothetical protein
MSAIIGLYKLINPHSQKVWDVTDSNYAPGNPMQQWSIGPSFGCFIPSAGQLWELEALGNGYVKFISHYSNMVLGAASNGSGYDVVIDNDGPSDLQKWSIQHIGNGIYTIENKATGKIIEALNSGTDNGIRLQLQNNSLQLGGQWMFMKVDVNQNLISDYRYKFLAMHSRFAMDVNEASLEDGAKIQQWTDNGTGAQRWRIEKMDACWTRIRNILSYKNISTAWVNKWDGTDIIQWQDNWLDNQLYRFERKYDGTYAIRDKNSWKLLDVKWDSYQIGFGLQLWHDMNLDFYGAKGNQRWIVIDMNIHNDL